MGADAAEKLVPGGGWFTFDTQVDPETSAAMAGQRRALSDAGGWKSLRHLLLISIAAAAAFSSPALPSAVGHVNPGSLRSGVQPAKASSQALYKSTALKFKLLSSSRPTRKDSNRWESEV